MSGELVLVLNSGSSSVKFAVIDPSTGERPVSGLAERVGTSDASLRLDVEGSSRTSAPAETSHAGVVAEVLGAALDCADRAGVRVEAVGHRVVHGGTRFPTSSVMTRQSLAELSEISGLAPLHNPAAVAGIEAALERLPDVPHVAVFDTAFHADMPERAWRYAVPRDWVEQHHVRRYGFHGTSHQYVCERAAEVLGRPLQSLRIVSAHLGNGCSVTAVDGGRSVDTSMGLTPLEGLVMGTRSGDVDPGLHTYLHSAAGLSADEVMTALNSRSGLLALSGSSNDMRTVRELARDGDEPARVALEVFCYRLAKYVAGFVVALGGLDAIVFTGGIGENDADTRADVLSRLAFLGVTLDADANAARPHRPGRVISGAGPVTALVVPTDEELVIARDARTLARATSTGRTPEGAEPRNACGTTGPDQQGAAR